MSKRLILILACAFVVGLAFAAYAEVQNVKVSGDIQAMTVYRNEFDLMGKNDLNRAFLSGSLQSEHGLSDDIFLSIARVKVDADLTDNVSATIRLIGEWVWGQNDNAMFNLGQRDATPGVDIDLAYVTLKEFLYSPLTVVVGRQELHYGNDMIIGDSDTNQIDLRGNIPGDLSPRKAFDAVRAILDYNPLTVDVVYSKISSGMDAAGGISLNQMGERVGDYQDNDIDLYGVNAKYEFRKMNTILEGYYWYTRTGPRAFYPAGTGAEPNPYKSNQLHTYGARISTDPLECLNFQLEGALQRGRYNSGLGVLPGRHIADYTAWALETGLTYNFKKVKYTPVATLLYAYFSGENFDWDSMITDSYRGWNPMFENQSYGHVANALMPQTNVQLWGIMGTAKPMEDITVKGEYYQYWFVNPWPVLFNYWGDALLMDDTQRFAGQELDLTLTYDYTEDVQFNLLTGWFMPGKSFADINRQDASEVIGSMKVTF